jgi:hypothetical protein
MQQKHLTAVYSFLHMCCQTPGWNVHSKYAGSEGLLGATRAEHLRCYLLLLLQLRAKHFPGITHADLFSLAGSIAPELAGGPPIAW